MNRSNEAPNKNTDMAKVTWQRDRSPQSGYHKPRLTVAGNILDITLGGSPGAGDSGAGSTLFLPIGSSSILERSGSGEGFSAPGSGAPVSGAPDALPTSTPEGSSSSSPSGGGGSGSSGGSGGSGSGFFTP